jgi:hypothetical protein
MGKLDQNEVEFITRIGTSRYRSKRSIGISDKRSDGSRCSVRNDIQAAGAEYFAAKSLECPFNEKITTSGDGGHDFVFAGLTVDAIWLGEGLDSKPRKTGHLIVNPHEPQRWARVYVLVGGNLELGYELLGCISHDRISKMPQKDFGYGPRFAAKIYELSPISKLIDLRQKDSHA